MALARPVPLTRCRDEEFVRLVDDFPTDDSRVQFLVHTLTHEAVELDRAVVWELDIGDGPTAGYAFVVDKSDDDNSRWAIDVFTLKVFADADGRHHICKSDGRNTGVIRVGWLDELQCRSTLVDMKLAKQDGSIAAVTVKVACFDLPNDVGCLWVNCDDLYTKLALTTHQSGSDWFFCSRRAWSRIINTFRMGASVQ